MHTSSPTRPAPCGIRTRAALRVASLVISLSALCLAGSALFAQARVSVMHPYAAASLASQPPARPNASRAPDPRQHLGEWMSSHRNQPIEQQQRALEQEPGFRQLTPEIQQRMRDRLSQLNGMSPQRRQQVIARTEAMERLTPQQRQQVRNAAGQLGSLPEDRRRAVARAFHDLRSLPDAQRQAALNSPQLRSQFTDPERSTLNNLLTVAPYLPLPQRPPGAPPQP